MSDSPLVSICIGVYNREKFLEANLKSILAQTYNNIEIIVSDNASTDNSVRLINEILNTSFVHHEVYVQKINLGPDENYKFLAEKAHGQYIALFHSDDVYAPTIIEDSIALFENEEFENVGIVMSQSSESVRIPKRKQYPMQKENIFLIDYKTYIAYLTKKRANILNCPTAVWTKEALLAMEHENRYPDSNDLLEYVKILRKGYVILLNNRVLHTYTRHAGQDSSVQKKALGFDYPGIYKATRDFVKGDRIFFLYPSLLKYWAIETFKILRKRLLVK